MIAGHQTHTGLIQFISSTFEYYFPAASTHTISIVFLFICIVNLTLSLQHWFSLKKHCLWTVSIMNVWIDCGLWSQGHIEEKQQPPKNLSLRRREKQWIFYRVSAAEGSVGWLRDIYGVYQTQISHRGLHTDHRLWQLFIRWTIGEFPIQ